MTQKEQIRQEIERRKKGNMYDELPTTIGRYYEDRDLLAFIDSLPEEKPLEDLEEAAARYERENRQSIISSVDIVDAFIAGAEWQREKIKKEEVECKIWEAINRYELEKKLNHEEGD